jgi:hypothetical protein
MRVAWRVLLAAASIALVLGGPAMASVPKVVMIEDFTSTW